MSYYFPEGSKFYFSSTFAAAKTVSGVSNANPALATSTSHGYSDGDIVLFESGWEDATDSVFKVDQQSADTFQLLGLNSTDTDFYPAGAGTGTTKAVSSWTEIPQILSVSASGGDARFTTVDLLAKRNSLSIPTGFNAMSVTLQLAHDPGNANYATMLDLSRTLSPVAFKVVMSGGAVGYAYGYLSVSEMPSMTRNQVNSVNAAISFLGRFITYTS